MKTLLATIAILLSANLAAQDNQFKIKGFYADMPRGEFQAVAESHGALFGRSKSNQDFVVFQDCDTPFGFVFEDWTWDGDWNAVAHNGGSTHPMWLDFCGVGQGRSSLTIAGFDVYSITRWGQPGGAPLTAGYCGDDSILFSFGIGVDGDKLLERLIKHYG